LSANANFFLVKEKSVDLRVIDFDWAGKQDKFIIRQNGIQRFSGLAKQEDQLNKIMIQKW